MFSYTHDLKNNAVHLTYLVEIAKLIISNSNYIFYFSYRKKTYMLQKTFYGFWQLCTETFGGGVCDEKSLECVNNTHL